MADNDIDRLKIQVEAEATKASNAIDRLANSMLKMSQSLGVDTHKLMNIATSIRQVSDAATGFKGGKSAEITSLARSLTKFSSVDTNSIYGISSALQNLANGMAAAQSIDASGIAGLVNAISKLGGVKSTAGTDNLLRMKDDLVQFIQGMNSVGSLNFDVTGLSNLIYTVSRLGTTISSNATTNLPAISAQLQNFVRQMNNIGSVSFDATGLYNLVSAISRLGSVASGRAITNIPQLAQAIKNLMTTLATAPQVSNNLIQMTNAIANLAAQGSKAGTASNRIQKGLDNVSRSATTAKAKTVSLAQVFGKLYANFFWVIRGIKKLNSAIQSTTDYIEAFNYYTVAFGKIGSEWDDEFSKYGYDNATEYANSFAKRVNDKLGKLSGLKVDIDAGLLVESGAKNLGLNIQEITQYASQLASVTNSLGQSGETTTAIAKSMTMLAGDISSLFNVDYSTVATNLQSGLIGQSRALYKYGIDITNATLQTYAYNLGIEKSISEMSQMEKQQLRVLAILDQSKVSWGDLANTINSPSNMIRQLSTNFKETGMVLGQLFIPMLQKVLPVINGATIAVKRLLVNIASLMGIKIDFESFGQSGYKEESGAVDDVADSYDNAAAAAKKWQNQLMGFDEINKLTEQSDKSSGKTAGAKDTLDLTDEILKATENYEKVWNKAFANMENEAQKWADKIYNTIVNHKWYEAGKFIGSLLSDGVSSVDWEGVGKWISNTICDAIDFVRGFIDGVDWNELGKAIVEMVNNIDVGEIIISIAKLVFSLAGALIDFNWGSYQGAWEEGGVGGVIARVLAGSAPGLPIIIKLTTEIIAKIKDTEFFKAINDWWDDNVLPKLEKAWEINTKIIAEITNVFKNTAKQLWDNFKKAWKTAAKAGIEIANDFKNTAKEMWEDFKDSWLGSWVISIGNEFVNTAKQLWDKLKNEWDRIRHNWIEITNLLKFTAGELWEKFKGSGFGKWTISIVNTLKNTASQLWNNFKTNWGNRAVSIINTLRNTASELWAKFKAGWRNFGVSIKNVLLHPASTLYKNFKIAWSIAAAAGVKIFNRLAETARQLWNKFKENWYKLNPVLNIGLSLIDKIKGLRGGGGGSAFATGGFPEDGVFYANHNELVGRFSNGKTAVANNDQITTGIREAVVSGMLQVFGGMNMSSQPSHIVVQIDGKEVFSAVQKQADDFTTRTGQPAFLT